MSLQSANSGQPSVALYVAAAAAVVAVLVFAVVTFQMSVAVEDIDHASVVFEGFLALLPVVGLFQIQSLRDTHPSAFWFMFIGLLLLAVSMTTDTLDELVAVSDLHTTVFEGLFQVLGFLMLLIGLRNWLKRNEEMKAQLSELATTDYLTGIANRRHFMRLLRYQLSLCERTGSALSLIMIDLDHFKRINDSLGHDAGDEELKNVARLISQRIRKSDKFARLGGEEFVLMTPSTTLEEAAALAETLRSVIESAGLRNTIHLTASFGVATCEPGEPSDALLKRADKALYEAKQAGRNRVMQAAA